MKNRLLWNALAILTMGLFVIPNVRAGVDPQAQPQVQPQVAARQSKEAKRLKSAAYIVNEIMQTPEKGIPRDLLGRAVCVGAIPSELRLAFGFGANYGRGALVCRKGGNGPWGAPSMFTLYGGNFGFQIGVKATDLLFIVMNTGGVRKLLQTGVKLGVDASAAAGPVGRTAEGATDLQIHAEILSYSRSRGLFAGVSLAGAMLRPDYGANYQFYRHVYEPKEILIDGLATPPDAAKQLDDVLAQFSPHGGEPFPLMSQADTKAQDTKTPAQGLVSTPAASH